MKKKNCIVAAMIMLVLFAGSTVVMATNITIPNPVGGSSDPVQPTLTLLNLILTVLMAGIAIAGVAVCAWRGYKYQSASSEMGEKEAAKKTLVHSIIAFVLIFLIPTILKFILGYYSINI